MYSLRCENTYGESMSLTHNPSYTVISVEGLNPPAATINSSVLTTSDGSKFNSSRVGERNLVITLAIHPDVEKNRLNLYRFFKSKQFVKIFYKNSSRDVFIEGYVESFEVNLFESSQRAQISILCPSPYFKSVETLITDFSSVESLFEFEFSTEEDGIEFSALSMDVRKSVVNEGEVESGMIIEMHALGPVMRPTIYNVDTGEFFRLNYDYLGEGDTVTINTNQGEKSARLNKNGQVINVLNYIDKNSSWLMLGTGDNIFTYDAYSGYENLQVSIHHTNRYGGV